MILTLDNPLMGDVCTWCSQEMTLTPRELVALRSNNGLAPDVLRIVEHAGRGQRRLPRLLMAAPRLDS